MLGVQQHHSLLLSRCRVPVVDKSLVLESGRLKVGEVFSRSEVARIARRAEVQVTWRLGRVVCCLVIKVASHV